MTDARTDQALVEALQAGDQAAFAPLFDRWADPTYDVARRILHDDGRAAEVTQEVFTMAWQQIDTLRDPGAFGGWVLRMTRNKALDRLRHESRAIATDDTNPALRDLPAIGSVEGDVEALDHGDLVWAASAALGERDASVLDLHLRHQLSVPEIAEELGVTTNNAHQLLHRMKERLGAGIRAYVLVRGGDASCPGLRAQLTAAEVTRFGPDAVKVIGQHVSDCDDCRGRQAAVLAPEAMFAAVPILVMAPALKAHAAAALGSAGVPAGSGAAGGSAAVTSGGSASSASGSAGSGGSGGFVGGAGSGSGASPGSGAGSGSGSGPGTGSSADMGRGSGAGSGGDGPGDEADRSMGGGRRRVVLAGAAIAIVLAAIIAAVLLSGGSDDESASGTTTTTVAVGAPGSGDPTTTTTAAVTTSTAPTTGDIEGSWVADASDILAANTANVGGTGVDCSGPITMTFAADGTFDRSGTVSCSLGGMTASGTISTSGRYAVADDQITISGTTPGGRMTLGGRSVPTPDSFGDGAATYEVSGNTLTITFTESPVGTVTQTYQRA